jgi:chaperone modulatory protein CbpM
MKEQKRRVVSGVLIEDHATFTLQQLCRACAVPEDCIAEYVEEGILQPRGRNRKTWQFSQSSLRCTVKARRLQRDLDINLAGVAVILELLEELETLRAAKPNQPD